MSEKTTGSRSVARFTISTKAKPAIAARISVPAKIGRAVTDVKTAKPTSVGPRSASSAVSQLNLVLATMRGTYQPIRASTAPIRRCVRGIVTPSARHDMEPVGAHDCIPKHRRDQIREPQPENKDGRESDAGRPPVDPPFNDCRRLFQREQERRPALETVGHRGRKKARTDYGYGNSVRRQHGPDRLAVGP